MKRLFIILLALTLTVALSGRSVAADVDFEEQLKKLAEENGKGYIGPFSTAFGTNMNSGLYHSAKPHAFLPIPGFDISIKFTVSQVSEEDLTYSFILPDAIPLPTEQFLLGYPELDTLWINPNTIYTNTETPTAFGESEWEGFEPTGAEQALLDALSNAGLNSMEIEILRQTGMIDSLVGRVPNFPSPPGIGVDILPLIMPQVSVGLPLKSEVLLRYMPEFNAPDFGKISFTGVGLKHNLSQWIPVPMFPVDISAQFVWQQIKIGELIESTHTAFNLQASKKLGLPFLSITPYVGVGFESSSIDVSYEVENPEGLPYLPKDGTPIEFSLKGKNKSRLTGGLRLGLTFLTINADYSSGEYDTYSAGIGLTLR